MRLAIALHLGDLEQRLPARAALGVVSGHGLALDGLCKHDAVADVGIVRDRQDVAAGLLLIVGQKAPESLGIRAVKRAEGQHLFHPKGPVTKDYDPVQVVAIRGRAPFVPVECSEGAGLVVSGGSVNDLIPDGAFALGIPE